MKELDESQTALECFDSVCRGTHLSVSITIDKIPPDTWGTGWRSLGRVSLFYSLPRYKEGCDFLQRCLGIAFGRSCTTIEKNIRDVLSEETKKLQERARVALEKVTGQSNV